MDLEPLRRPLYFIAAVMLVLALESTARLKRLEADDLLPAEIHAIDQLAATVRRGIANILWTRVDEYLHASDILSTEDPEHHGQEKHLGVSSKASSDQLYPMVRLIAVLDPSFVRAGSLLGGLLTRDEKRYHDAVRILQGIIRSHPEHPRIYSIYWTIGNERFRRKELRSACAYLERAVRSFPRLNDKHLMEVYDEPPPDQSDMLLFQSALGSLMIAHVELGEFDEAMKYFPQAAGFSPGNRVIRTLARYRMMKSKGAVDTAELTRYYEQLEREEKAAQPRQATDPTKLEFPGAQKSGPRLTRKAQPVVTVDLGLPRRQAAKMLCLLFLMATIVAHGVRNGWLRR